MQYLNLQRYQKYYSMWKIDNLDSEPEKIDVLTGNTARSTCRSSNGSNGSTARQAVKPALEEAAQQYEQR